MPGEHTDKQLDTSEEDLRGQLLKRLAVAGVLVAVLLGVLAFFDHLSSSGSDDEGPTFTQAVPVQPKKEVSQPVKPAEDLPAPPAGSGENSPPPEKAPEPRVETPAPPVVEASPAAEPARTTTAEATRLSPRPERAPRQSAGAHSATAVPRQSEPAAVPEETAAPVVASPNTSVQPTARVVQTQPATQAPQPVISRLLSGFVVQAGVFSSVKSAEELHAKLTLNGVPSTLETRVQVGPFKTRQEAEEAQQKLKALGIESVLVSPRGR